MAFGNYSDLQTDILAWLARAGDTTLSNSSPDFIALCEDMFTYGHDDGQFVVQPLRIRPMETSIELVITSPISGNTVGGTPNAITLTPQTAISSYTNGLVYQFTAVSSNTGAVTLGVSGLAATAVVKDASQDALSGDEIIAGGTYNVYYDAINGNWVLLPQLAHCPLPKNYLAMRSWFYIDGQEQVPLQYLAPQSLSETYLISYNGKPRGYTIIQDAIRFGPNPDSTYYAPCDYYRKFDPLASAPGNTNWLLKNKPSAYLYGSLFQASIFKGMTDKAAGMLRLYQGAINSLQKQDERDRHSGSPLTMRTDTGNP